MSSNSIVAVSSNRTRRHPGYWISHAPSDEVESSTPRSKPDTPMHQVGEDGTMQVFRLQHPAKLQQENPRPKTVPVTAEKQKISHSAPVPSSLSKARMNKRLLEFMVEPSQSEDTAELSPTGSTISNDTSSSNYSASKQFWVGLMNRVESESTASYYTDASSRRSSFMGHGGSKTPTERRVFRTFSNASSVTMVSPAARNDQLPTPSSSRRTATVGAQWKSPRSSAMSPRGPLSSSSQKSTEKAFNFSSLPPTPRSVGQASTKCKKSQSSTSTPRMFGDDRTNSANTPTETTPRIFGDDRTNSANTPTETTPKVSPKMSMTIKTNPSPRSVSGEDRYTPLAAARLKAYRKSLSTGSPLPAWISEIRPSPKHPLKPVDVVSEVKTVVDVPPAESQQPVIQEITKEEEPMDSVTEKVSRMTIANIPPKAKVDSPFQPAYDAWARVGLMRTKGSNSRPPISSAVPRVSRTSSSSSKIVSPPACVLSRTEKHIESLQSSPSVDSIIQPVMSMEVEDIPHVASGETAPSSSSDPESGDNNDAKKQPSAQNPAPVRRNRRTKSDSSGFSNILKHWKTVSADKPNTHFLSPEQKHLSRRSLEKSVRRRLSARPPRQIEAVRQASQRSLLSMGQDEQSLGQSEAPDAANESFCTEDDPRNESFPPQDFSVDFDVDVDLVSEQMSATDQFQKIRSLVDSDIFEDDYSDDETEVPSRALVILENKTTYQVVVGDTTHTAGKRLIVRNLEPVDPSYANGTPEPCECSKSIFSGNNDLVDFFLPKLGMACTCGKSHHGIVNLAEPAAIENILRPWQVEFVKCFGVDRGDQLVKARHRSGRLMARSLKKWRMREGMVNFDVNSCGLAVDIWAKTCKAYVRSVRQQIKEGEQLLDQRPGPILRELSQFVNGLPPAPRGKPQSNNNNNSMEKYNRHEIADISIDYDTESQMEV